jgi:hypothetical protein
VDINLSSGDETMHQLEPDAPTNQKVLAGNDTGDMGAYSAEPTAPAPIGSSMPEKSKPSAADRSSLFHPLASVAESAHLLLLSDPNLFLQLIK